MTGTTLTTSLNFFITIISIGCGVRPSLSAFKVARKKSENGSETHLELMTGRSDKVKATMDPGVQDIPIPHSGQLLPQISRMLILNILYNRIPTPLIINHITITRGVDYVETEFDLVFDHYVGGGEDFGGLTDWFVGFETTFGVD